ncbi:hypothetical protein BG006_006040 [Podila minutissima]|uniref:Uncharacterized protein n=1 Tax=Podila minutissima TaxID=64525 RepID=A0A9P5SVE3_9FUNG|nr:hypothetical protein BG006_006040 [Podila minutissima]
MVAVPSRAFWLTLLAVALATTAAAPVDSPNVAPAAPVKPPNVVPVKSPHAAPAVEPSDYAPPTAHVAENKKTKLCLLKCYKHFAMAFPYCKGRFTPEDYSSMTFCHILGYFCTHACSYKY